MTIKEQREKLGMTQTELAKACKMSPQFICDIEKGRTKPSLATAIKIAQILGVDDINFFSELVTSKTDKQQYMDVIKFYETLAQILEDTQGVKIKVEVKEKNNGYKNQC